MQLRNKTSAENMVKSWPNTLLGGSTARLIIDPAAKHKNAIMMKGAPLDGDDELIRADTAATKTPS